MKEFMDALDSFITASNSIVGGTGIDEIYVHPLIYHELIRYGIGEPVRSRYYETKRIEYKGVDIKQGRPSLPPMKYDYTL